MANQITDFVNNLSNPGYFSGFIDTAVWSVLVLVILGVVATQIRNQIKYRYRGEIEKRRQFNWQTGNPEAERISGKAGYFKKKGEPIYRIKYGPMPWQIVDIKKLPDPQWMQGKTAYFLQYNVGELVQARKRIDWAKGSVIIEPVDSTTKAAAKQEMAAYSQILTTSNRWRENAGIIIMGIILISGIIALYFVSKACSGGGA